MVGNQFPTSVVDCVGNNYKYCLCIDDNDMLIREKSWDSTGKYAEIDWRNLGSAELSLQFISVTGEASCEEAAEVIKAIAKLRQEHDAFVIANRVKIKSDDISDSIQPIENIKAFDVVEAILAELDPEEQRTIKELLTKC